MRRYLEPSIHALFFLVSVIGAILPVSAYVDETVYQELFLTHVLNAVVIGLYLIMRFIIRSGYQAEAFKRGMLLFILYSSLPIFILMIPILIRVMALICLFGSLGMFLLLNLDHKQDTHRSTVWKTKGRVLLSIPMILFGIGFFFRGIDMILKYAGGEAHLTEMLVSISDIIICLIWVPVAVGFIRKKQIGISNILACYIQSSLLFISLILFMLINPMFFEVSYAAVDIIVVAVMGGCFFCPTFLLLKHNTMHQKRGHDEMR